ncbi:hypothetical protein LN042_23075 [Kitasatospora sp. RB6PN24]|uniref:hypothetical protein n=1 Tax=Kitasatospora humi TaxID=2893891 RepID=UPI001E54C575|nr:hypothetical protein [Kitasatospora humi]MCC9309919.1 hypothetical protein [Kitasatospora humi]
MTPQPEAYYGLVVLGNFAITGGPSHIKRRPDWMRFVITHLPTQYIVQNQSRTPAPLAEVLTEALKTMAARDPRTDRSRYPADTLERYPKMIAQAVAVYEDAVAAIDSLTP